MIEIKLSRAVAFLCCVAIAIVGCTPAGRPLTEDPLNRQAARAERLMATGDYLAAERSYRFLAERATSPARERYQISAVDALVKAGKDIEAKRYAKTINPYSLSPPQRAHLDLVIGQIELSAGNAEQALMRLNQIDPDVLEPDGKVTYHDQRAFAYSLTGQTLESARERIQLQSLLKDSAKREENSVAILETLMLLPVEVLRSRQPPPPNSLGGWMELARILKTTPAGSQLLDRRLRDWRQTYSSLSVDSTFLRTYAQKPGTVLTPPSHIAVLLPQSGPYAKAGKAVREGFAAAHSEAHDTAHKPYIEFYDSQAEKPGDLYQRAIANGADFVIGPLEKHHLKTLAKRSTITVPILALNQVPGVFQDNLYQLALTPEDEAEQVANSAWSYGHRHALLMVPSDSLGRRVAKHFVNYWQQLGGKTVSRRTYNPANSDFSGPIKELLALRTRPRRASEPGTATSALDALPRERQDADFIFLVAFPREARLIRPQLQFYGSRLPIFATSHVYSGRRDSYQDSDLNDIIFCDVPWLFENARRQIESTVSPGKTKWKQYPGSYLRLIALGIDAYDVIPHLGMLRSTPFPGTTGTLLMRDDNRIHRELPCAQFRRGIPRLLGQAAPRPITTPIYRDSSEIDVENYVQ